MFGACGARKWSSLRAGLTARTTRTALVLGPGRDPVERLALAVAGRVDESVGRLRADLTADPESPHGWQAKVSDDLLLVVDQVEEVLTLCPEEDRRWPVRALTFTAGHRTRGRLGVRADFYGHYGHCGTGHHAAPRPTAGRPDVGRGPAADDHRTGGPGGRLTGTRAGRGPRLARCFPLATYRHRDSAGAAALKRAS